MLYRDIKQFNPVEPALNEHKDEIIREMACNIIKMMNEDDFLKLFIVTQTENNFSFYHPIEIEVKLIM